MQHYVKDLLLSRGSVQEVRMSSREVIPISGVSLREVRRNSSHVIASLFLLASLTRRLVLERGIGQPIRRRRFRAPRWD